jgi:hypothetical protein
LNNKSKNINKNSPKKSRGFQKGNKLGTGRPVGSRNAATLAMAKFFDGESDRLSRKAVEMALEGDTTAMKLCLERILPPRKDRPTVLDVPELKTIDDAPKIMMNIVNEMSCGNVTVNEALGAAGVIKEWRQSYEANVLENRLAEIEKTMKKQGI